MTTVTTIITYGDEGYVSKTKRKALNKKKHLLLIDHPFLSNRYVLERIIL